jgi:hypothetical protein
MDQPDFDARIQAMPPHERVARSIALFSWMREMIGRQIQQERRTAGKAEFPAEHLKLRVAERMYAGEPAVVALIQRRLADVSG